MKKIRIALIMFFICSFSLSLGVKAQSESIQLKLSKLTVEQKIDLLCAKYPGMEQEGLVRYNWWSECLHGVARAGKATVFPKPIAMGCMWDNELMLRIGTAIGNEARAKHRSVVSLHGYSDIHFGLTFFSPTLNIARDPRWGRTSECFSEDPLITSDMGVAFIKGLQGDDPYYLKAVATAKHFVANNEENRRLDGSATIDEVSLREYYFPAFKEAIIRGHVTSVMGAYNALNGIPCCANPMLLNNILRGEWGFQGVVISDGSAIDKIFTHHKYLPTLEESAAAALKAGCDMSLRDEYRSGLKEAYARGLIDVNDLDQAAGRVLTLRARLGLDKDTDKGNPYKNIPYSIVECTEHQQLALEAAEKSMVLLKNNGLLPLNLQTLDRKLNIALIGDAFKTVYYGDYSGMPDNNLTLFDCLQQEIGCKANLTWIGERSHEEVIPSNLLHRSNDQAYDGLLGFTAEYFDTKIIENKKPVLLRQDLQLDVLLATDKSLKSKAIQAARWTSTLTAPQTGRYMICMEGSGRGKLWIDGQMKINKSNEKHFKASFEVNLIKGKSYDLKITCEEMNYQTPIQLTWKPPFKETDDTPEKLAKRSDIVLLFVRDDNSSEGRDRRNLNLSDAHTELIQQVTSANASTVLILGSGSTLSLRPIISAPAALLNVWIAGQGEAQAIGNILMGKTNPSGKTAVTFYANESELPALDDYDITHGRSYQYFKGTVLFPFGFGLSYTTYEYSKPQMTKMVFKKNEKITVNITVKNTGKRDGEEIVQCYLSAQDWEKKGLKQKLVGYKRVALRAGESKSIIFSINEEQLKRWNADTGQWQLTTHAYELSVVPCSNQRNTVSFEYK